MLVNILTTFDASGRRWLAGENPDVPVEVAAAWIADGKAAADTDGAQNNPAGVYDAQLAQSMADGAFAAAVGSRLPQFGAFCRVLPTRSIVVTATGVVYAGACAIASVRCITPGTAGSLTIDDALSASATRTRFTRLYSAAVAGTDYPLVSATDQAALLLDVGAFATVPTGGVYVIEIIGGDGVAGIDGVQGAGLLCAALRVTASGVVVSGLANVVSLQIIERGSAGNLALYEGTSASGALRHPVTAYSALANGQLIRLGPPGGTASFQSLYATVPTGAVVLVNLLPS